MALTDYEVLDSIQNSLMQSLIRSGIGEDVAINAASEARELIRTDFGGQMVYFTKSVKFDERDIEIAKKWTGSNMAELAREYKLSVGRIYRCISNGRAATRS